MRPELLIFLMSTAEEEINVRQQKGKLLLLSFWVTW
jgi:hypothetical protein